MRIFGDLLDTDCMSNGVGRESPLNKDLINSLIHIYNLILTFGVRNGIGSHFLVLQDLTSFENEEEEKKKKEKLVQ